ncbi:TIGR03663 family protein [Haloplanus rubicundus]|uniref:TIGR03663 family protein n=1 Tax=Haloplanus rubicundus TaxID=1547898 RepID=A0A345E5F9_9EURY|nr:flippase activity-associated protein Agl23 [Haloplanus rubicundus]AXG07431.1 TIGR03663 family protein [Haloplanus rubicundus]AXG10846.1 TIGR03663 family protein [Haloplanus rubicundus]
MSAADPSDGSGPRSAPVDRVVLAVVAVTLLALLARFVGLGSRPFHWDEARVGYWSLRFLDTGAFEYRPVAGGPFLYVVERFVLGAVGATDATARAVVAVVGGCSPLLALLFRRRRSADASATPRYRLTDTETVAMAGLLAVSPTLLYYGRFLRGDLPLAVFGLVVVGCTVRVLDAEDAAAARPYRYLGAAALAVAVAASAFVVGYLLCWLAAAALTVDQRRLVDAGEGARDHLERAVERLRGTTRSALGAVGVFLVVHLFFYAPRVDGSIRPSPAAVEAAFLGAARAFYGVRVVGRRQGGEHQLLPYLSAHVETLLAASAVVVGLAAVGFLADRYGRGETRPVIAFHAYWAGASLLVFPVITEESAAWLTVHTVAPAVVPAAAAVGLLGRYASRSLSRDDAVGVAVAALLALAVAGQLGVAAAGTAYGPTTPENPLAHHAQPADDLDPFVADVSTAIEGNDGVDVLFYGPEFVPVYDDRPDRPPVSDAWGNRLPLPWYLERLGAETDGVREEAGLDALESQPPVVVADASRRAALAARLEGYESSTYRLSLWNREVVVFVR